MMHPPANSVIVFMGFKWEIYVWYVQSDSISNTKCRSVITIVTLQYCILTLYHTIPAF